MKYYVVRINKSTGEKHYMKTKTVGGWIAGEANKSKCWKFSKQGAKNIAKRYSEYTHPIYTLYEYGIEPVEG